MSATAGAVEAGRRTLIRYAVPGLALAAVGTLVLRDPHGAGSWGTCPSLLLFGVYCPGCGTLRGLHDLATGQVVESLGHNLLLIPALVWLTWWWAAGATAGSRHPVPRAWDSARFCYVLVLVLAIFTVARNLPGSVLAP